MKKETKIASVLLGLALLSGFGLWIRASVESGFVHCVKFTIMRSAHEAFQCGNYYFGVFGPYNYDVAKAEYFFGVRFQIKFHNDFCILL